jgi:hypothetical protein
LALFFLNILLIQVPRLSLRLLKIPISYLISDKRISVLIIFRDFYSDMALPALMPGLNLRDDIDYNNIKGYDRKREEKSKNALAEDILGRAMADESLELPTAT